MKLQITARFTGSVLFEHEAENNTIKLTLESAVKPSANLIRANLSDAIYKDIKIKHMRVFSGLYKYQVIAIIAEDDVHHIALGCKFQSREDWKVNFWNNTDEFPDNDSEKTELRKFALRVACEWLDMKTERER